MALMALGSNHSRTGCFVAAVRSNVLVLSVDAYFSQYQQAHQRGFVAVLQA